MRIFVAGCTGFVGGHLVRALSARHELVCLVRDPRKAEKYQSSGITIRKGDITDPRSLEGAMDGIDLVVNLVGIIEEKGRLTYENIHVLGTSNLVAEAVRVGVRHFFYQSALGAREGSWSRYFVTKAKAERIVSSSGLPYTIFRPSLIVGQGDGFTARIKGLVTKAPAIPIPGSGRTRLQPIYIDDWIKCFSSIMDDPGALNRAYDIGGPEHITYEGIVKSIAAALGIRKPLVHIPAFMMKLGVGVLGPIGLSPVTMEQIKLLDMDNVCDPDAVVRDFGFEPIRFDEALGRFISAQEAV